ncbi:porin [Pseudoduganella namucuonensis]|uniref:Outer membrane protein (Porin) n=1 Tax=Pseudoduganella namucuonensis TaxID=1035707 RepID=A0A1I7LHV2_9BURK|nr:porin [Pseudoduganella namucuonensis]SFV09218.1 Outer membrane protein (porin) [Pseudoduganella namucuonensis]
MKKTLGTMALLGAFGAVTGAHAQSSVTIYGTLDAGIAKISGTTAQITKRDNNKLGFRGVEDLGNGLKALFQLEVRFEPDTGTVEAGSRPLFQGQSRVGLQGGFGTIRLGRGLTAYQEASVAFEPWNGLPTVSPSSTGGSIGPGFQPDLHVAGYTSDPLGPAGNSRNRFSNAVFYNSPLFNGFQVNLTVGAKEANGNAALIGRGTALAPQYPANSVPSAAPYSLSATYNNGRFGALAAYERNAVETDVWAVAASYKPTADLKLMASYQKQDQSHTMAANAETKAWVLGANYTVGAGKVLLGYGQKTPDAMPHTKQASVGYEHSLSPRTYVYADLSNRKSPPVANQTILRSYTFYGVGVHHNF